MDKQKQGGLVYDNEGVWVHSHVVDFGATGNIAVATGSTVEIDNNYGHSTIGFYLNVPSGAVVFEGTFDGINWESCGIRCTTDDQFESSLTGPHEANYIGSIASFRKFRVRVTSELSSVGTLMGRMDSEVSTIEHIEFNAPPHRIGYTLQLKDKTITSAATGTAIWTPTAGKKIVLTQLIITAWGATDAIVEIYRNGGGEGNRFFYSNVDVSNKGPFQLIIPFNPAAPFESADDALKITTSDDLSVTIVAVGYEV
jgi:hypothetical protein